MSSAFEPLVAFLDRIIFRVAGDPFPKLDEDGYLRYCSWIGPLSLTKRSRYKLDCFRCLVQEDLIVFVENR